MKPDSLSCFDCAMFRSQYDVDCLRHTPDHLRSARRMRIEEAIKLVHREHPGQNGTATP